MVVSLVPAVSFCSFRHSQGFVGFVLVVSMPSLVSVVSFCRYCRPFLPNREVHITIKIDSNLFLIKPYFVRQGDSLVISVWKLCPRYKKTSLNLSEKESTISFANALSFIHSSFHRIRIQEIARHPLLSTARISFVISHQMT